ncbi:hypothetical protein SUNI508_09445 [Seiridium unicorne]|uniref:FAD/NAD(P)-binding domain-containing protein n=1 Tax=Seiridium unicorne TaxID=138068 RepID=A0ABR2UQ34_9PEZI
MVAEFTSFDDNADASMLSTQLLDPGIPITGKVVLQDGKVLENIHHVIIAVGYPTTFPFLGPQQEKPLMAWQDADEIVASTADGTNVHNLHEDIFYIPNPP